MKNKRHLVILGGGFAGTKLAAKIEKSLPRNWEIFLLSKTNTLTYHPLLPEVVGASILPSHAQTPIRHMLKRTRIRMVSVTQIDFDKRIVYYQNNEPGELSFDQLVIAAGVDANLSMISGLNEYALPLKTVGDAIDIRNQMIECLEQATIHPRVEQRKNLTTFIVVGGGFSGVEVAGQMEDFLLGAQQYYKNVKKEDCRIILVHDTNRLLPGFPPRLANKIKTIFDKRNITVYLNTQVSKIGQHHIILNKNTRIDGALIVCTIGTQANCANLSHRLPSERGKIVTRRDLSVSGIEGVWALGDCALVPNTAQHNSSCTLHQHYCPATAQCADQQARHLAKNIINKLHNKPTHPFSYRSIGMLAAIGRYHAVAEIYGIQLTGFFAFILWRALFLLKIPSLTRKTRILFEWSWGVFFKTDIAHLGFKRTKDSQ